MKFDSLEDRMLYLRSMTDYKLIPNSYVMIMLDGKNFSSKIKKTFKLPFDFDFIDLMDRTAAYVCSQVQGSKFAYVQSDEISILLTDFDTPLTDAYFDLRLSKLNSIIASIATSFFNREIVKLKAKNATTVQEMLDILNETHLYQFDCKCWNLMNFNDVFGWFLYRQNDCIRNSKQQAAQTYVPHRQLLNKNTDEQVEILKEKCGIDWNNYSDIEKYGRFIYKEMLESTREMNGETITYNRNYWLHHPAFVLNEPEGKEKFENLEVFNDIKRN